MKGEYMKLTIKSILTGRENTMDLDVTAEQLDEWVKLDKTIQSVFPNLNDEEREFLMTGVTQEEYDEVVGRQFPEDDDLTEDMIFEDLGDRC
jgi:hypothetical protein